MQDSHFNMAVENTPFESLNTKTQSFIREKSKFYRFTFSQIRQIVTVAVDMQMWSENIQKVWSDEQNRDDCLKNLLNMYDKLKNRPKQYEQKSACKEKKTIKFQNKDKGIVGFGRCPVASEKTRCCNLLTLDVYEGCGFECSYCSIQTFYGSSVKSIENFDKKLSIIKLEPDKLYHIGTGQSSDSLMFGNKNGVLEALINFARKNENVILEFKSKSNNITYLLNAQLPPNIICTFSLNPDIIVQNEERFTASLEYRLKAAKILSDHNILVGFHFHPMIFFDGWEEEYQKIAQKLIQLFSEIKVALVSMGTLTFTKSVLKQIRLEAKNTKILQMPLVESCGKYSYPLHIKELMFKKLYQAFEKWHDKVFFYLCMEDKNLWQKIFGYEYESNDKFEEAMKKAYMEKILYIKGVK